MERDVEKVLKNLKFNILNLIVGLINAPRFFICNIILLKINNCLYKKYCTHVYLHNLSMF